MPDYVESEYFEILIDVIRPEETIPFECYVLMGSTRLIQWTKSGEHFTLEKYQKILRGVFKKVYVKNRDKQSYFDYLNQFLKSPEGAQVREKIEQDRASVAGLPDVAEYALDSLGESEPCRTEDLIEDEAAVAPAALEEVTGVTEDAEDDVLVSATDDEENEHVEVTGSVDSLAEEEVSLGDVDVDPQDEAITGAVTACDDQSIAGEGVYGEIMQKIRAELDGLNDVIKVSGGLPEVDEDYTVKDVTEKIEEELHHITSVAATGDVPVEHVKGRIEAIKQELLIVKGRVKQDHLNVVERLAEEIHADLDQATCNGEGSFSPSEARRLARRIQSRVKRLPEHSRRTPRSVLSAYFNRMLAEVEGHLGHKLVINSKHGEFDEVPDSVRPHINFDDVVDSKDAEIDRFKHLVVKQGLSLKTAQAEYKKLKDLFATVRDEWFLFFVQAKKSLAGSDLIAGKKIDQLIKDFDAASEEYKKATREAVSISQQMTMDIGGKSIRINPDLLSVVGSLSDEDQEKLKNYLEGNGSVDGLEESRPAMTLEQAIDELDEFQVQQAPAASNSSEIELLRVQLENSAALLDASNQKIEELEGLIHKNRHLVEALEEENTENRKQIDQLEEQTERYASAEMTNQSQVTDQQRLASNAKAETEELQEKIRYLSIELEQKQTEIDDLRKKVGFEHLLEVKDKQMSELGGKLARKMEEVGELKKSLSKAESKLQQESQNTKRMANKMYRLQGQQEASKKQTRSMTVKYKANEQALVQARKSIGKLTELTETLRRDRQKYIRETNEAMAKFEVMAQEAKRLSRQAESVGHQRNEAESKAAKQIEDIRALEKELNMWKAKYAKALKKNGDTQSKVA